MAAALNFSSSISPSLSFHKPFLSFRHECSFKILFTTERFAVHAAASRKSRKAMSNVELLDEIKQFLYSVGLPEDHVPSMKELSLHGRTDLANIVRRRGYKLIGELLAESKDLLADGLNGHKIQMEMQPAAPDTKEALEGQDEKMDNLSEQMYLSNVSSPNRSANSDVNSAPPFDGNSLSNEDLSAFLTLEERSEAEDSILRDIQSVTEGSIREEDFGDYLKTVEFISHDGTSLLAETSENLVVEEASGLGLVDNLGSSCRDIHSSDDTSFEENYFSNENVVVEVEEASSLNVVDNLSSSSTDMPSRADSSLEDNYSCNPSSDSIVSADGKYTYVEHESSSSLEEKVAKFMENGYLEPVEGIINHTGDQEQGAIHAKCTANEDEMEIPRDTSVEMKLKNLDGSESSLRLNQITATRLQNTIGTKDGQLVDADLDMSLDAKLNKDESLAEISHLKQMLHQKELELSRLKELIEQEKLALSSLQDKAENEISKAQKLILEKDAELQAAEESLSGLVEVEIQYSGEGEIVEVTGSFNGWEHWIKMDPEDLTNSTDSTPSRKSKHWSTTLWLYPGTYEIKFVIDGQWKIDPQKETMNKGSITNNILRVHPQ